MSWPAIFFIQVSYCVRVMDDMVAIHLIEKLFGWIMKYLCCCHYILCTSIHPQQGVEASNSQEDGIFGDATPSPSETINVDDSPSADPNFSQDTGTGGEEVCVLT